MAYSCFFHFFSLPGVLPFAGAMFFAYEVLDAIWDHYFPVTDKTLLSLVNGCFAGSFAQTVTFPLDTIRRKMQVNKVYICVYICQFYCIFQHRSNPCIK